MKALESIGYVTPKDYTSYLNFHIFRSKNYRMKSKLFILGFALLGAIFIALGFLIGNKGLIIGGGAVILCLIMFFYTVNNNVKRICKSKAKIVRAKQHMIFGKNGLVLDLLFQDEAENEHDEIFYDELEKVYLAQNAIYLYVEKRSVLIIPKRNLKVTPEEARAFLEKYIPDQILVICN